VVPDSSLLLATSAGHGGACATSNIRAVDARRDRALRRLGYRVLRLESDLVLRALPVALQQVRAALAG